MRTITHGLVWILSLAALTAQDAGAAPAKPVARAPMLQEVALRYATAKWPQGQRRIGLDLGALVLPGLTGAPVELLTPELRQRPFADAGGALRLGVEVLVAEQPAAAQEQMLTWLAYVNRPGTRPSTADAGLAIGDIGYVGWSNPAERRIAWIAFVRDNVAVRVSCFDPSADPHPDVAALAQAVDLAIGREPLLAAKAPLPRPAITAFRSDSARCRAGDVVGLVVAARDPAAGAVQYQFVLTGPGQGYVEQDERGRWWLHTTAPGRLTVELQALGSRGTTSTATLAIDVAPER